MRVAKLNVFFTFFPWLSSRTFLSHHKELEKRGKKEKNACEFNLVKPVSEFHRTLNPTAPQVRYRAICHRQAPCNKARDFPGHQYKKPLPGSRRCTVTSLPWAALRSWQVKVLSVGGVYGLSSLELALAQSGCLWLLFFGSCWLTGFAVFFVSWRALLAWFKALSEVLV